MQKHIRIDIPPKPEVLINLSKEIHKDSPSILLISSIISQDVGLAGGILSLANSPRFAGSGKFTSIKEAAIYLGLDAINIFTTTILFKRIINNGNASLGFFWEKSLKIAEECVDICSNKFFSKFSLKSSELYTYGLFKDSGQAILILNFEEYSKNIGVEKISVCDKLASIEEHFYGTSHSKPGHLLCYYWGLPNDICMAVKNHHSPESYHLNEDNNLNQVLMMSIGHLGHIKYLAKMNKYDQQSDAILPVIFDTIGLNNDDYNDIINSTS